MTVEQQVEGLAAQPGTPSSAAVPPQAPPAKRRGAPRLAALDALRLVAALAVACYHYFRVGDRAVWGQAPGQFAPLLHRASMYGWLGVEAFFVISGFVICMSAWGRTPGQFMVSRISRLYPAYWVVTFLALARWVAVPGSEGHALAQPRVLLANLTMFPAELHSNLLNAVGWTLAMEARFYLLIGLLLFVGLSYARVLAFCTLWLVAAVAATSVHSPLLDFFVMGQYAGLFITGMLVYLLYRFGHNAIVWTLLAVAWSFELTVLQGRTSAHAGAGSQQVSWTLSALALTAFLLLLMLATIGPLARIEQRWMVLAGALTFPFYLVHQVLGMTLARELTAHVPVLGTWGTIAVTFAAMLALAWAVYRWVDQPGGRLMRRQLAKGLSPKELARATG